MRVAGNPQGGRSPVGGGKYLVEVYNEDSVTRLRKDLFVRDVKSVLRHFEVRDATVRVVFLDLVRHREMNRDFLGHDYDTDVITFPIEVEPLEGEIYVNVSVGRSQAIERKIPHYLEWRRLVIHGVLHLVGLDDATEKERGEMRRKEDFFLQTTSK